MRPRTPPLGVHQPQLPGLPSGELPVKLRQALEDRWVPSTLQVVNGLLTYTAGAGVANNLSVSLSGTTYTFKVSATNAVGTGPQSAASNAVKPCGLICL